MGTNQKIKLKSISDILNERIQTFVQRPDTHYSNGTDYAAEFS